MIACIVAKIDYKTIRCNIVLNPLSESIQACCLSLQARDFYVEMKWEFTSWGKLL